MPARVGSPKGWWGSERMAGLRKDGSWGKLKRSRARLPDPQEAGRGTDLDQLSKTRLKWRPGGPSWELLSPEFI